MKKLIIILFFCLLVTNLFSISNTSCFVEGYEFNAKMDFILINSIGYDIDFGYLRLDSFRYLKVVRKKGNINPLFHYLMYFLDQYFVSKGFYYRAHIPAPIGVLGDYFYYVYEEGKEGFPSFIDVMGRQSFGVPYDWEDVKLAFLQVGIEIDYDEIFENLNEGIGNIKPSLLNNNWELVPLEEDGFIINRKMLMDTILREDIFNKSFVRTFYRLRWLFLKGRTKLSPQLRDYIVDNYIVLDPLKIRDALSVLKEYSSNMEHGVKNVATSIATTNLRWQYLRVLRAPFIPFRTMESVVNLFVLDSLKDGIDIDNRRYRKLWFAV